MYYDRILSTEEALFISRAQQRIAELSAALADESTRNDVDTYKVELIKELQYAIETLPVDVNVYLRFAEMIDKEVALIKAWRKSDNRIRDSKE